MMKVSRNKYLKLESRNLLQVCGVPVSVPPLCHKRSRVAINSSTVPGVSKHTADTAMVQNGREYLQGLGTGDVVHNCGTDFYQHLTGVQDMMQALTNDPDLIQAGLFHSIYGTEGFQDFTVSLQERPQIKNIISDRAEHLCYVNCVMDRGSLDAAVMGSGGPCTIQAREEIVGQGNTDLPLTQQQFTDLMSLHLGDWLQQVEMEANQPNAVHGWTEAGQAWGYRRGAFRRMAEILGGPYLEMYDRVFAREPEHTKGIHQIAHPKRPQPIASH